MNLKVLNKTFFIFNFFTLVSGCFQIPVFSVNAESVVLKPSSLQDNILDNKYQILGFNKNLVVVREFGLSVSSVHVVREFGIPSWKADGLKSGPFECKYLPSDFIKTSKIKVESAFMDVEYETNKLDVLEEKIHFWKLDKIGFYEQPKAFNTIVVNKKSREKPDCTSKIESDKKVKQAQLFSENQKIQLNSNIFNVKVFDADKDKFKGACYLHKKNKKGCNIVKKLKLQNEIVSLNMDKMGTSSCVTSSDDDFVYGCSAGYQYKGTLKIGEASYPIDIKSQDPNQGNIAYSLVNIKIFKESDNIVAIFNFLYGLPMGEKESIPIVVKLK